MSTVLLLLAAIGQTPEDLARVRAEYFASDPNLRGRYRYLVYSPEDEKVDWPAAINWGVLNASSLQPDLAVGKPVVVAPGIAKIDLVSLKWRFPAWLNAVKAGSYPYSSKDNQLFIRADWLLHQLADSTTSDLYTEIQWGERSELNRDKILDLMKVDRKAADVIGLANGWLEVESQVAINRERVVEMFATLGGTASGTRDFLKLLEGNRPLDRLDLKGLEHDGEEWIVTAPRVWPGGRGALQFFLLSDGDGGLAREAPVGLVEDKTRFRGISSIRYPGSCWRCHDKGYNPATANGLALLLKAGVELKAETPEDQADIERKWLADLEREIKRTEEDLEAAAEFVTGKPLADSIKTWMDAIDSYDEDVSLAIAAGELGLERDQFKTYLAAASDRADIGVSLVQLAHDKSIKRTVWEGAFLKAQALVEEFEDED